MLEKPIAALVYCPNSLETLGERITPALGRAVAAGGTIYASPISRTNGLDVWDYVPTTPETLVDEQEENPLLRQVSVPTYDLHEAGLYPLPPTKDAGDYYSNCRLLADWIRYRMTLPMSDKRRRYLAQALERAENTGD